MLVYGGGEGNLIKSLNLSSKILYEYEYYFHNAKFIKIYLVLFYLFELHGENYLMRLEQ